jgi:threonine dehydrogenase-like Zn-dependent dehydrogenase
MKAAVVTSPGTLELREVSAPEPGSGQVRVRSAYCGICATDLAMMAGNERTRYPLILGHEWSGVVDAVGPDVDSSLVGTRCVAENAWAPGSEVGFEHPGAYGELFVTQARLLQPLPASLTLRRAALIEPLAVCVRAMRRLRVSDASSALVFGDGVIGLLLVVLLAREGVREITVAGGRARRLAKARELGAHRVLNYHDAGAGTATDLAAALRRAAAPAGATGGSGSERSPTSPAWGFANVLEASGSSSAVEAAFVLGAMEAHILLVGDYAHATAAVPWQRFLHSEYEVMTSNASAGAWPEAVRLAGELGSTLDPLVTHTVAVPEVHRGMELMRGRDSGAIRVLIDWGVKDGVR